LGRRLRLVAPLIGIAVFALAACGQTASVTPLAADQTFVWPMQQRASIKDEALDPAQIQSAYDVGSAQMLYSGLVTLTPDLTVKDDLARSHEISADGKTYTFHLYPDLKFNDGTPIRSNDFAYAINRSLNPCVASPVSYYLYELQDAATYNGETCTNGAPGLATGQTGTVITTLVGDSILTPDSQTLVLKLSAPASYFLEALTYPTAYPLEKSLLDKYPDGQWVMHLDEGGVSGPFQVGSYSQTYNGHPAVVYVPNPDWKDWHATQARPIHLTKVIRPFVNDADAMYQEYRAGTYDYTDVPSSDYPYARGQQDFYEIEGLEIQAFWLNVQLAPFDSQSIRQAFDLALNKQLMADRICQGGCIPTNHIVPQGVPGYNPNLTNPSPDGTQSLTGNQTQAVKLLQQAIQACHGPSLLAPDHDFCPYVDAAHYSSLQQIDIYVANTNATRVAFVNAAVQQWNTVFAPLKLTVKVQLVDSFNTFLTGFLKGTYGMFALGWVEDYPDPQDWISNLFTSNSGNNFSHVQAPDLDKLMAKADQDPNPVTRMQEYHLAEQQLVEMVPWISYEQPKITWRQRSWVRGFSLNGTGSFADTSWPGVYIAQH
jgi:oligopeptide transport system substrate-binding protein